MLVIYVFAFLVTLVEEILPAAENLTTGSIVLSAFLYIVARLAVLVEIFRTLCFLPPDAYKGTWNINFPHIG